MNFERIALTCAPGGENHVGNQFIGKLPIKGSGFTASDIEHMGEYFQSKYNTTNQVHILNLNTLSTIEAISNLDELNQGRLLLIKNYIPSSITEMIYNECTMDEWDSKYLDPKKYRTEIVDGKETKIRGKILNKHARTNICYVDGLSQEPNYIEGKGTIIDLKTKTTLHNTIDTLYKDILDSIKTFSNKIQFEINVVEGNRYYNLKKTGIGFHGDTERTIVICLSIGGGGNYPMRFQWFKNGKPIGKSIDIQLNDGDLYIMSEKTVGCDWKLRSKFTIRHAAGANKYISLDRWNK
jgi:hypothetical protein